MRLYKLSLLAILPTVLNLGRLSAEARPLEINYDKRLELTMMLYLIATKDSTQQIQILHPLKQAVTDYFEKYSRDPAVRFFKEIEPHLSLEELSILALYHSEPPEFSQLNDYPYILASKLESANLYPETIESFIKALNKFYKKSKFEEFWQNHLAEYEEIVAQVRDSYENLNIAELVEDYYGAPAKIKIKWIVSPLLPKGFWFSHKSEAQSTIYYIMASSMIDDSVLVPIPAEHFMDIVMDEFGHSYVDPLTAKYHKKVAKRKWLFKHLDRQGIMTKQFLDWPSCLNEHIVRAVRASIYLAIKSEEEAINYILDEEKKGFRLVGPLYYVLEEYEENRDKYPNLASFYPVLLASLDCLEPVNKHLPFLGVLTQQEGRYVVVGFICPKSAAEQASLKVGDKILGMNGIPIKNEDQFSNIISEKGIGSTVKMLISRDDAKYEIPVTIGSEYVIFKRKEIPKPPKPRRRMYY
jgi:hypothetical protein